MCSCATLSWRLCSISVASLHWHGTLRMGAADLRRLLAVPSDDADALVDLAPDIFRGTGLQKGDAARAARSEDPLPGVLHLWRIRLTGHLFVAQDQSQVTWAHFGKANARHTQDLLDIGHALQALNLDAQQQFSLGVQGPGIGEAHVFLWAEPPHPRCRRLRTSTTGANAETTSYTDLVNRIATRLHKRPHRVSGFRLTEQDAMHATGEDLPELPGIVAHDQLVRAVYGDFDNHCRRAVTAAGGAAVHQAMHIRVQPGHVEGAVFHADVDVIGPGVGVLLALLVSQDVPGMATDIINRLAGF